jgi:hypothetical protein
MAQKKMASFSGFDSKKRIITSENVILLASVGETTLARLDCTRLLANLPRGASPPYTEIPCKTR